MSHDARDGFKPSELLLPYGQELPRCSHCSHTEHGIGCHEVGCLCIANAVDDAYARGKADAEQQVREAVERDAARGRFVVEKAAWHRRDGRTFLAIEVAPGADLSCVALREDALDAAIERARSMAQGGENGADG